jgi:hypothetical protein
MVCRNGFVPGRGSPTIRETKVNGSRIKLTTLITLVLLCTGSLSSAENYVNWRAGFWVTIPDGWDKVGYEKVDFYLAQTDTSQGIFDYEAVFAPPGSEPFITGPYVVIRFDSTGHLSDEQVRARMQTIADNYSDEISETSIIDMLTELRPGTPEIDWKAKAISVLTKMAVSPDTEKMLWQYIRFVAQGYVTFYFFSPVETFDQNKQIFRDMVSSFSTENLKEAAGAQEYKFTDVSGGDSAASETPVDSSGAVQKKSADNGMRTWMPWLVGGFIVLYLIWRFAFSSRR